MKITNKFHRIMSLIAAICLILPLFSGFLSMIRNISNIIQIGDPVTLLSSLPSHLFGIGSTVIFMIVLFRGKKDLLAGILTLATVLYPLVTIVARVITLAGGYLPDYYRSYTLIGLLADFVLLVFYICMSVECLSCGSMSGSFGKIILVVLPLFSALLDAMAGVFLILFSYAGADFLTVLVPCLTNTLPALLNGIPMLLVGIAYAIPVREQIRANSIY